MLEDMRQPGFIKVSHISWSTLAILIQMKNGDPCFHVDYRNLKSVRRKDCFPLPWIDDTLDMLTGTKWFSTLNLKSGF
jgi:hypothetical protein